MYVTIEQIRQYTCAMERKFLREYEEANGPDSLIEQGYETNSLLEALLDYPEVNDRTKQRFYYLCQRNLSDVTPKLTKAYERKFGIIRCGLNVNDSYACKFCDCITRCRGLDACFGCVDCRFSDHLLFCSGQRHKSYMAFDKPVTKKRFAELSAMSPEEIKTAPECVESMLMAAYDEISKAYQPRRAQA